VGSLGWIDTLSRPSGYGPVPNDVVAFYDALSDNESAREAMQDDTLKLIARELADRIRAKASLDWTQRETVRADMRRTVRRLLAKYGYPPDAQETATQMVIRQAELMAEGLVI
jgi:type I restriction enzyme R subunit